LFMLLVLSDDSRFMGVFLEEKNTAVFSACVLLWSVV
jgi:hypothetical protein